MECAFQYSGSAFIKQIQQLVNFLLLRVRPPGNGLMSQRASLLTVCWKTICKTAKITTTYGMKGWQNKANIGLKTRTNVLWMNVFLQSWNCPVSEILTFSEDVSSRPSSSEIEIRKIFYFIFSTKKLLDDGRHEEGGGDQAGGEQQQGHGAASDDGLGQGSIFGLREQSGKIVLLILINIRSLPWPASLIPSCSVKWVDWSQCQDLRPLSRHPRKSVNRYIKVCCYLSEFLKSFSLPFKQL